MGIARLSGTGGFAIRPQLPVVGCRFLACQDVSSLVTDCLRLTCLIINKIKDMMKMHKNRAIRCDPRKKLGYGVYLICLSTNLSTRSVEKIVSPFPSDFSFRILMRINQH